MLLSQAVIIIITFIQCVQNYCGVHNVRVNVVVMYGMCQIIVVHNKCFVFFFFSLVELKSA